MKFYAAPMEGITGHIFRNTHATFFKKADKYFTPFITTNQHGKLSSRELNDILPAHNMGLKVIPQILSNHAEDFIKTTERLASYGYEEVNLNLGCPSGTVVSKNRGAGFLSQPEALDQFLEDVFSKIEVKLSLKTRIGKDSPEEFARIMEIYNQYPLEELIIHPRIQKDYYRNTPNKEVFKIALASSKNPVCYNGDIFTVKHYETILAECPSLDCIMLGRGLISNPGLIDHIEEEVVLDKVRLRVFHDQLLEGYQQVLSGDRNVLFKMKESWFYMSHMFSNYEKYVKKIRKSQKITDYQLAVDHLFEEQKILEDAGLFSNSGING